MVGPQKIPMLNTRRKLRIGERDDHKRKGPNITRNPITTIMAILILRKLKIDLSNITP
tara:strand:- start:845 stop:1018 length:174 start_codon:yes stop_codon:yes gene_type:complete